MKENKKDKAVLIIIIVLLTVVVCVLTVLLLKPIIFGENKIFNNDNKYFNEYVYESDGIRVDLKLNNDYTFKLTDTGDTDFDGEFFIHDDKIVLIPKELNTILFYIKDDDVLCMYEKECDDKYLFAKKDSQRQLDIHNNVNNNSNSEKKEEDSNSFKDDNEYLTYINSGKKENLKELVEEEIETFKNMDGYESEVAKLKAADLSDYKEDDKKINVYIFRGSTCPHCLDAALYFAQNAKEYGKYYNIVSYEVWNNKNNSEIMNNVGKKKFNEEVTGVPYIVIGDKTFSGFSDSIGKEMLNYIIKLYNEKNK